MVVYLQLMLSWWFATPKSGYEWKEMFYWSHQGKSRKINYKHFPFRYVTTAGKYIPSALGIHDIWLKVSASIFHLFHASRRHSPPVPKTLSSSKFSMPTLSVWPVRLASRKRKKIPQLKHTVYMLNFCTLQTQTFCQFSPTHELCIWLSAFYKKQVMVMS